MGARLIVQLANAADPAQVNSRLRDLGASPLAETHPELRDVYTTIIPDDVDVQHVLSELKQLPMVRHAEIDQFRTAL